MQRKLSSSMLLSRIKARGSRYRNQENNNMHTLISATSENASIPIQQTLQANLATR